MESSFQCWGSIAELSTLKFNVFRADTEIRLYYHQWLTYCHAVLRVNNKYFTLNVHMNELFELHVLNGEITLSDEFSSPSNTSQIFSCHKKFHTHFFTVYALNTASVYCWMHGAALDCHKDARNTTLWTSGLNLNLHKFSPYSWSSSTSFSLSHKTKPPLFLNLAAS